jgi:hypothetical protein
MWMGSGAKAASFLKWSSPGRTVISPTERKKAAETIPGGQQLARFSSQ